MIKDFLKDRRNDSTLNSVIEDLIYTVFDEIDNDLSDMQDKIRSGNYSNNDILDRIEEIRNSIY